MWSGGPVQFIEDDARLYDRYPGNWVEAEDRVEVPRCVDDDPSADRVAGDARAGAAHRDPKSERARNANGGREVVRRTWRNNRGGEQAIVRRVGRVDGAPTRLDANLAGDRSSEAPIDLAEVGGGRQLFFESEPGGVRMVTADLRNVSPFAAQLTVSLVPNQVVPG